MTLEVRVGLCSPSDNDKLKILANSPFLGLFPVVFLSFFLLFLEIFLIFKERGREGERKGEKHEHVVASHAPPTGDLACSPGICPDWESNQRPFGLQAGA